MRRRLTIALTLVASLVAGLLAAPAVPAAPTALAPKYGIEVQEHIIPTKFGKIYARIAHPVDSKGKIVKGPAIFTYSPYWVLGTDGADFRRSSGADHWTPMGYHRVWADVVGTGNSGGCYDYGGNREKVTGAQIVEWVAKQKWSTGKVGMIGGSYEGTTATAAAVMQPKGLTTIVPEAAISRWYGYAYAGGIRFTLNNENPADEGFDTPLLFDAGLAIPPPLDAGGEDWQGRFLENVTPCDELDHIQHGYDDTPDYDKFWVERDYLKDADKIKIPVLVAHNWGDWNVKQAEGWNLFHALDNAEKKVLYMGDRYTGHGTPDGNYTKYVDDWMAHYLMGVDNGIESSPTVVSETSDYEGPIKYLSSKSVPKTTPVKLYAQQGVVTDSADTEWELQLTKPRQMPPGFPSTKAAFPSAGINTESHSLHHARSNHDWWWFESPMLAKNVRMFGTPKIQVQVSAEREWVTITPLVVDINPGCHMPVANQHATTPECTTQTAEGASSTPRVLYSVTRGWLDSRYRNGLAKQQLVEPGKPFDMTVVANPQDYTFKKGHHIGLMIATELNEWSTPKPYPCTTTGEPNTAEPGNTSFATACTHVRVHWEEGATSVTLPLVNPGKTSSLFDLHAHH
jgi:X-Pro dipeptidyl-peptidase